MFNKKRGKSWKTLKRLISRLKALKALSLFQKKKELKQ
jgi:hypothetical protein